MPREGHTTTYSIHAYESKNPLPLKLSAIFSLVVNLCNFKLAWLLLNSTLMFMYQFCFIYLNICVNCAIFTFNTPQILTVQFSLL